MVWCVGVYVPLDWLVVTRTHLHIPYRTERPLVLRGGLLWLCLRCNSVTGHSTVTVPPCQQTAWVD